MKALERMWIVGLLAVFVVACAGQDGEQEGTTTETAAPAEATVDTEADAQAIRDRSNAWLSAAQARDAEAIAAVFAADGEMIETGEPPHVGPDAIRANAEQDWTENPDFTVEWTISDVHVAESGDLAYERGQWTYDPDGEGEASAETGEYLTVWKKVDGEWKVAADVGAATSGGETEAPADEAAG